jgi:hypothetical protein
MDKEIIERNRRYLHSVENWIAPEDYGSSRDHYGCPPHVLPLLNLPINEQPTYTDLLVYAAQQLSAPVRYLELGVSVGKNFYVLANSLADAVLVGFDWERINPLLEQRLEYAHTTHGTRWYRVGSNRVGYVQGDIASRHDWAALAGTRFNLILSDACHQPTMLLQELTMLQYYDLLDPAGFVMVWDDLDRLDNGAVTRAFLEIAEELQQRHDLPSAASFRLELNGWLGQHEHKHTVGVINNIGLSRRSFA